MRERPGGIDDSELRHALSAWRIDATSVTYVPVGFGDYHWIVGDGDGRRRFVTVADLAHKPYCGVGTDAAFAGLSSAMDTALALRSQGLDCVVAPLPIASGGTVLRHQGRFGISVFPLLDGVSGQFSRSLPASERGLLIDQLGELHRAAPPASTPVHVPQLATRSILERALSELDHPWRGGPFAEPTRALLREHLDAFRRRLDEFDRGISTLRGRERVVTHGEPHPGNVLRLAQRRLFVDWDTVGLAVPERDLWWVVRDSDDHARYAEASGRRPDPAMLALYRLRWDLDDASVYVGQFREAHRRTADTEKAWAGLIPTMERVVG